MTDNGEVFNISVSESETEEDIRLIKGIKRLNEVFECYPYLKEIILELADRL